MPKTYKTHLAGAIHETCELLHQHGIIESDMMRDADASCLAQCEIFSPNDIKELREREELSPQLFARYLNVTPKMVEAWETGHARPAGTAMLLLSLIKHKGLAAITF